MIIPTFVLQFPVAPIDLRRNIKKKLFESCRGHENGSTVRAAFFRTDARINYSQQRHKRKNKLQTHSTVNVRGRNVY